MEERESGERGRDREESAHELPHCRTSAEE